LVTASGVKQSTLFSNQEKNLRIGKMKGHQANFIQKIQALSISTINSSFASQDFYRRNDLRMNHPTQAISHQDVALYCCRK
jgi:hypothetical protein